MFLEYHDTIVKKEFVASQAFPMMYKEALTTFSEADVLKNYFNLGCIGVGDLTVSVWNAILLKLMFVHNVGKTQHLSSAWLYFSFLLDILSVVYPKASRDSLRIAKLTMLATNKVKVGFLRKGINFITWIILFCPDFCPIYTSFTFLISVCGIGP